MKGMYQIMITSPNFWLGFVFIPLTTLLFDFVVKRFAIIFNIKNVVFSL